MNFKIIQTNQASVTVEIADKAEPEQKNKETEGKKGAEDGEKEEK